jgi:hypothetical protein
MHIKYNHLKKSINTCKTIFQINTNYGKHNFSSFKYKFITYNSVQKQPLQAYKCLKISTTVKCTKSINKLLAKINFCTHNIKMHIHIKELKKFKSMRKHELLPCKPTMNSGLKEKTKFESSKAIKSKTGHMTWYRESRDAKYLHFSRFHH